MKAEFGRRGATWGVLVGLGVAALVSVGCHRSAVSEAQRAQFTEQFVLAAAPAGAVGVDQLWQQLVPAEASGGTAAGGSAPTQPTSTSADDAGNTAGTGNSADAENSAGGANSADAETQSASGGSSSDASPLATAIHGLVASPTADLTTAIPAFPFEEGGRIFYLAAADEHGGAGHAADCPFCAAKREKSAGGLGQLVRVELVDDQGAPWKGDLRQVLELKSGDAVWVTGTGQVAPTGLVTWQAKKIYTQPSAAVTK